MATLNETNQGCVSGTIAIDNGYLPREINITKVLNGFIVKVGCKTVVFQSLEEMLSELKRYYKDPSKVEEEYLKRGK